MRSRPLLHLIFPRWPSSGVQEVFFHRFAPNVLLIVSSLARREGWDVRVIDDNFDVVPLDEKPDAVAISVWTCLAPRAYQLADAYRARGVPVILGGVHASLLPGEALRHADAVVAGEVEGILGTILADVLSGSLQPYYHGSWDDMDGVPGVTEYGWIYKDWKFGRYQPTHTLQTTRGCRYNCDFCSVIRINGRRSRHMDPERVVEDIFYRKSIPPRVPGPISVTFLDDDLAADLDYAHDLFAALIRAKAPVLWSTQLSIGIADHPELLEMARRAGAVYFFIGFESVERGALLEANKKNRPHRYGELIKRVHDHGIGVEGSFIFGFDHDEADVFDHTVEFISDIEVDAAHFTILTPYPGTGVFARMYEEGRIIDFDWSHYNYLKAVIQPARMTPEALSAGVERAYRTFYSRNRRWKRFLRGISYLPPVHAIANWQLNKSYPKPFVDAAPHRAEPYQPPMDEVAKLVATSRADANEALATAGEQAGFGWHDHGPAPDDEAPVRLPASSIPVTIGSAGR